jgi:hypothetical protein
MTIKRKKKHGRVYLEGAKAVAYDLTSLLFFGMSCSLGNKRRFFIVTLLILDNYD